MDGSTRNIDANTVSAPAKTLSNDGNVSDTSNVETIAFPSEGVPGIKEENEGPNRISVDAHEPSNNAGKTDVKMVEEKSKCGNHVEEQLSSPGILEAPSVEREITGAVEPEKNKDAIDEEVLEPNKEKNKASHNNKMEESASGSTREVKSPSLGGLFEVISKEVWALVLFWCSDLIGWVISVRTFITGLVTKYSGTFVAVLLVLLCVIPGLVYLRIQDKVELHQCQVECKHKLQQLQPQLAYTGFAQFAASALGSHVEKGTPWNPTT